MTITTGGLVLAFGVGDEGGHFRFLAGNDDVGPLVVTGRTFQGVPGPGLRRRNRADVGSGGAPGRPPPGPPDSQVTCLFAYRRVSRFIRLTACSRGTPSRRWERTCRYPSAPMLFRPRPYPCAKSPLPSGRGRRGGSVQPIRDRPSQDRREGPTDLPPPTGGTGAHGRGGRTGAGRVPAGAPGCTSPCLPRRAGTGLFPGCLGSLPSPRPRNLRRCPPPPDPPRRSGGGEPRPVPHA